VRAALTELEPGEVRADLREAVRAVPRRAPARRAAGVRVLAGLGAIAATVAVAVALVGLIDRIVAPSQPIAAPPSTPVSVPLDGRVLALTVLPLDPGADVEAIAGVLRVRLQEAGFHDATILVDGGRIHTEVVVGEAEVRKLVSARRLLTGVGRVEAFGLGPVVVEHGAAVERAGLPLLFAGEDVTKAVVDEPAGTLTLTLDADGTERFGEYTETHIGDYVAIALDGIALTVPSINEPITDGEIQVSFGSLEPGLAWPDQVRELVAVLASGPLPSAVDVVHDEPSNSPPTSSPPSAPPAGEPTPPPATSSRVDFRAIVDGCRMTVETSRPESIEIHVEFGSSSCQVERNP
jgi:hypothetical protein